MTDEELGILPLKGKYYGTKIRTPWGELKVWENPGGRPSDRELASYGMTPEQWEAADQDTRWDITCDCHYETQADYELARHIARSIVGYGTVHPERTLFMRVAVGEGKTNTGEKIDLSTNMDGSPLIHFKGRFYSLSWREIVDLAIRAINEEVDDG